MSEPTSPFEVASSFEAGEVGGGVRLGHLSSQYEQLFSEVIEDGVITPEERARLDHTADALGLDRARLQGLEHALTAAYEARRRVRVREVAAEAEAPVPADAPVDEPPPEPSDAQREKALERRVRHLETRIVELEQEIEAMRSQAAVEVDFSGVAPFLAPPAESDEPEALLRRLRPDPRDVTLLRALYRVFGGRAMRDRQWCAAHALSYLGAASAEEQALHEALRPVHLVRPSASLTRESWRRLLVHPDQEAVVGDIFSVVLGTVLLGRIAALRRDGRLPRLDPAALQSPATSTIAAVRCFTWAGAILGVQVPPLFTDPEIALAVTVVPATTPALRLGKLALSGRSPAELAFLAGEHLAYFRDDVFIRALFDSIPELEDLFLAALAIGNPSLPMTASVRARVAPIAQAVEPLLSPEQRDRLLAGFLRFVEEGGRTNLMRWAGAVDATAARAGLLLANDLKAAETVLWIEDSAQVTERMDDLIYFVVSDRYADLRKQIGVEVG